MQLISQLSMDLRFSRAVLFKNYLGKECDLIFPPNVPFGFRRVVFHAIPRISFEHRPAAYFIVSWKSLLSQVFLIAHSRELNRIPDRRLLRSRTFDRNVLPRVPAYYPLLRVDLRIIVDCRNDTKRKLNHVFQTSIYLHFLFYNFPPLTNLPLFLPTTIPFLYFPPRILLKSLKNPPL